MAVTTKKITTVDTATTFDDVFVNTNGTLRQVTKENFQQASGIATNKKDIATNKKDIATNTAAIGALNSMTKAYNYDKATGNFLDWVRTTFTSNGEYYVIYATNNSDGWVSSSIGSCLVQRRNNDYFLTAYINDTNVAANQTIYVNRYVANAWLGWSKLPRRSEVDANTAAITALNSRAFMPRTVIRGGTSLDTLTTPGMYLCVGLDETRDNAPFSNMLLIVTESNDRVYQKAIAYSTLAEATRQYWDNWKPWTKLPTRAEIDALNSRCQFTYDMKRLKINLYSTSFTVFLYNDDAQKNGFSISAGENLFSLYKIEAGESSLLWNLRQ